MGFSFVHCGEVFNTVSLYQRVLFERFHCIVCTETILFEGSHQKMELNEFFLPSITYKINMSFSYLY